MISLILCPICGRYVLRTGDPKDSWSDRKTISKAEALSWSLRSGVQSKPVVCLECLEAYENASHE